MIYICNSFSISMLDAWRLEDVETTTSLKIEPINNPIEWLKEAESRHGKAISAVGHNDTAKLFSSLLNREIEFNRITITLDESVELLIGQLIGNRPPEGSTTLPEGAIIKWLSVYIR